MELDGVTIRFTKDECRTAVFAYPCEISLGQVSKTSEYLDLRIARLSEEAYTLARSGENADTQLSTLEQTSLLRQELGRFATDREVRIG